MQQSRAGTVSHTAEVTTAFSLCQTLNTDLFFPFHSPRRGEISYSANSSGTLNAGFWKALQL